ncbi:MAG TPA: methylenetetrahydrofolate reductase [NAD(P)H] [Burkholderiaceae bacterium]|nr:methylenetetrahydrofolate reductase [NAD(P)H] [Burkholderiaceae bacterium]
MRTDCVFSVEFSPPRSEEAVEKLRATRTELARVAPAYYSVTFGAGGSTREGTLSTTLEIHGAGLHAVPHISCIASTRASVRELLDMYRGAGIRHLVALRGDAPSGVVGSSGEFRYAADLVELVRAEYGDWFRIEVAAYPEFHPQARSPADDLLNFVRKVRAGADSAITQYFYNADAYFRFVDDVTRLGCSVPIVPGIMPITNFTQLARFSDNCGAEIPRWVRRRLESFGDDRASIRAFGADVVTALCERLLAHGAPGLHFYTMNMAAPTLEIWRRIGLPEPQP